MYSVPPWWRVSIFTLITSNIVRRGKRIWKVAKKFTCADENVVALLFINPAEKNLKQREMMAQDNVQEQGRWHQSDTTKSLKNETKFIDECWLIGQVKDYI